MVNGREAKGSPDGIRMRQSPSIYPSQTQHLVFLTQAGCMLENVCLLGPPAGLRKILWPVSLYCILQGQRSV